MKSHLKVTVEGEVFEVIVEKVEETNRPQTVEKERPIAPSTPKASKQLESPLAGKVASIEAQEGKQVEEGDPLITLEAMKMNTIVSSDRAGIIQRIHIKTGSTVQEKETLISFE